MDNSGVGFFDTSDAPQREKLALIAEKRRQAAGYQKEHNELVGQIWAIELQLNESNLPNQQENQLREQLEELSAKVNSKALPPKIEELKEAIKSLEEESGISSALTRGSPYFF